MSASPLEGRRIVVTRPREDADALVAALEALGARVFRVPSVERAPVLDAALWSRTLASREAFQALVFTSRAAVERFAALTRDAGLDATSWRHAQVSAVGLATARALAAVGLPASRVGEAGAEALATELVASGAVGAATRVLFPCARDAREDLPRTLRAAGAELVELVVYETRSLPPPAPGTPLREALDAGVDAVVFASPSAVDAVFGAESPAPGWLSGARAIAIGTTTAARLRERGVPDPVVAERPELDQLVAATVRSLGPESRD